MNREQFAGYSDWRLPTLEEAMSLMEPTKKNGYTYIDPLFDIKQSPIWTSDGYSASRAWVVDFDYGHCDDDTAPYANYSSLSGYYYCVRAVR